MSRHHGRSTHPNVTDRRSREHGKDRRDRREESREQTTQEHLERMYEQMRNWSEKMEALETNINALMNSNVNTQSNGNENGDEDVHEQLRQERQRVQRLQESLLESRLERIATPYGRVKLRINHFDGNKSSPHTWMEQFERACQMKGVTNVSEKIDLLRENLAENSIRWFESRLINHAAEDWDDWKNSFLQNFMPGTLETIRKAIEFKFRWGSFTDYYYEKELRILKVFPADSNTVMLLIIEGLPDNVAREVLKGRPKNAQAVLDQLKTFSAIPRPREFTDRPNWKQEKQGQTDEKGDQEKGKSRQSWTPKQNWQPKQN